MKKLGSRMREHLAKLLTDHKPTTRAEQVVHDSCIAWLASLSSSPKSAQPGINPLDLQAALLEYAPQKVVPLVSLTPSLMARLSRLAVQKGATVAEASKVGLWLQSQAWLDKVTLILVLDKWEDWHARAAAEYPRLTPVQSGGNKQGPSAW